jgi:pimeloyl-ACP methyl ester carboxylesterase
MAHYTRSERLKDHQLIIEHLKLNPPKGWNKKFVLLGVSEGGPLVTRLTEVYPNDVLATLDWSGTGDWPWQQELWTFTQKLLVENPVCPLHKVSLREDVVCLKGMSSRAAYETLI